MSKKKKEVTNMGVDPVKKFFDQVGGVISRDASILWEVGDLLNLNRMKREKLKSKAQGLILQNGQFFGRIAVETGEYLKKMRILRRIREEENAV